MIKVLLIGVGGVGEAIARVSRSRPWQEQMELADYDLERAKTVQQRLANPGIFPTEKIDARDIHQVIQLARKYHADLIMKAVSNFYNDSIFDAAYEAGSTYSVIREEVGPYLKAVSTKTIGSQSVERRRGDA